jgi:hypothetical protein
VGLAGSSSCVAIESLLADDNDPACGVWTPAVHHDTSEGPHLEVGYRDAYTETGEKHTHSILSVNSAGVPSEPSAGFSFPRQNLRRI